MNNFNPRLPFIVVLVALVAAGCPPNANSTDTSTTESSTDGSGGSNSTVTAGEPSTTDKPATTSGDTTGKPDTTSTSGDTTGQPDTTSASGDTTNTTSTSSDTTGQPDTTSTSSTTVEPGTTSTSGDMTTGNPVGACPDGWTRARTITITNEPEKPLTNFQVSIKVLYDDDMKTDFSDLRFVDEMGNPLSHWLEDYTAPIDALVWVKVPAIAAAGTTDIEMCYGNPDAVSASDGVATFHFFDGFDGNALDPNKWETTFPVEFSLGALKVLKGAVYSKSAPGSFPNLLIETKARMVQQSPNGTMPGMRISSAQTNVNPGMYMSLGGFYFAWDAMQQVLGGNLMNNMGCCDAPVYNVYGLAMDEGNVYAFAQRKFSAVAKATWKKPFFIGLGYEYMKNAGETEIHDMGVDWVLIRKFTSIEPTTAAGAEKNL